MLIGKDYLMIIFLELMYVNILFRDEAHTHFVMLIGTVMVRFVVYPPDLILASMSVAFCTLNPF